MRNSNHIGRADQSGVALLIAIFVLLLISVVAITLLISSGTETALGANYRSSSTAYYAALAGLEEARGRLLPKNPNYVTVAYVPPVFPLTDIVYVTNALPGEVVKPWDSTNLYADKEYVSEFGIAPSANHWQTLHSVWENNAQGIPGPVYKWVRITAATEASLGMDVNSDGTIDNSTLIYYDSAATDSHGNPAPSLIVPTGTLPPSAVQVLQLTALAYLPNGTQKLLQYLVAPIASNLTFPAALTLDGSNVGTNASYPFSVPTWSGFTVNGNDQYSPNSCVPGANPVSGIGYTNNSDSSRSTITSAIGAWSAGDFKGWGPASPNVNWVGSGSAAPSLAPNLQTVAGLDSLVTTISQNADLTVSGPVTQSDAHNIMPPAMSATNPVTVVVDGDLTFNGWHATGYGILLVKGTFTYDPDASWDGIVLVIGKGIMYSHQLGTGQLNGAVLIATTVDSSGNPLPFSSPLGSPSFDFTGSAQSLGIYYSSCWVQYVQTPLKYQVLSFHEIPEQ